MLSTLANTPVGSGESKNPALAGFSFIASQMGHEDARMAYEVYSKWIGEMNQNQVGMLNNNMPTAKPPSHPQGKKRLRKVL